MSRTPLRAPLVKTVTSRWVGSVVHLIKLDLGDSKSAYMTFRAYVRKATVRDG